MFSYSLHETLHASFYSENQTYFDGASLYNTQVYDEKYGHTFVSSSNGSSRSGLINDTFYEFASSQWASTSSQSTQSGSFTSRQSYTDGDNGSGFGDSADVVGSFLKQAAATASASSHKYTLTSTRSAAFTQAFASAGTSLISGSATAVELGTSTYTTTANQTGTVYLFGAALFAQAYEANRGLLPPLRLAASAFAVTQSPTATNLCLAETITGTFQWITSFYERKTASTATNTIILSPPNFTITQNYTSSYEFWSLTKWSSTVLRPNLLANRKTFISAGYIGTGGLSSVFTSYSLIPAELSDVNMFAPVYSGISSVRVFTSKQGGLTIGGSTAACQWVFTGSAWSLKITKINSSTSTTLYATVSLLGANSTTTLAALHVVGNTTAILGPAIPGTANQMDHVSYTMAGSVNTSRPAFFVSGMCGTTFIETSASQSSSASSVLMLGLTYPASSLPAFKARTGVSFSTYTATQRGAETNLLLPSVWTHLKWNEASRGDVVSVNQ